MTALLREDVGGQRALRRHDRGDGRGGALEHVEEAVPLHAHPVPALGVERPRDEPAVIFEHGVEARLAQLLHEARRALDVGEHEGERPRGERGVAAGLTGSPRPASGAGAPKRSLSGSARRASASSGMPSTRNAPAATHAVPIPCRRAR